METKNTKLQLKKSNSSRITINLIFIIGGIYIILAALIYMMLTFNIADTIITIWMIFMALGISLSLLGLILMITKGCKGKPRNFTRKISTLSYYG